MLTDNDPLDKVLFQMVLGQEALDEGLLRAGIIPNDLHRKLVITKLKHSTWDFVTRAIDEVVKESQMN